MNKKWVLFIITPLFFETGSELYSTRENKNLVKRKTEITHPFGEKDDKGKKEIGRRLGGDETIVS